MVVKSITTKEFVYNNINECCENMELYKKEGWCLLSHGRIGDEWFFKAQKIT